MLVKLAHERRKLSVARLMSCGDLLAGALRCHSHCPLLSGYDEQQTLS